MSLVQFLRNSRGTQGDHPRHIARLFYCRDRHGSLLPQRYEAQSRVLIDVTKPDALMGQVSQNTMGAYIATQLKLIKDVQTAGLVVDSLGWAVDPANQAAFEAAGRPRRRHSRLAFPAHRRQYRGAVRGIEQHHRNSLSRHRSCFDPGDRPGNASKPF